MVVSFNFIFLFGSIHLKTRGVSEVTVEIIRPAKVVINQEAKKLSIGKKIMKYLFEY